MLREAVSNQNAMWTSIIQSVQEGYFEPEGQVAYLHSAQEGYIEPESEPVDQTSLVYVEG